MQVAVLEIQSCWMAILFMSKHMLAEVAFLHDYFPVPNLDYLPVLNVCYLPVPKLDYLPIQTVGLSSRRNSWIIFPSQSWITLRPNSWIILLSSRPNVGLSSRHKGGLASPSTRRADAGGRQAGGVTTKLRRRYDRVTKLRSLRSYDEVIIKTVTP